MQDCKPANLQAGGLAGDWRTSPLLAASFTPTVGEKLGRHIQHNLINLACLGRSTCQKCENFRFVKLERRLVLERRGRRGGGQFPSSGRTWSGGTGWWMAAAATMCKFPPVALEPPAATPQWSVVLKSAGFSIILDFWYPDFWDYTVPTFSELAINKSTANEH